MTPRPTRLVISVCGRVPQRQSLELAVEFGRLFDAQISGLIVEDRASHLVGSIPFAREYVPGRALWQDLGLTETLAHQDMLLRRVQDIFNSIVLPEEQGSVAKRIECVVASDISSSISNADIVAFAAPAEADEWMSLPFSAFAEAALLTGATSLLLPVRLRRRSGPVVVLASSRDARALETAAHLARQSGERLVILAHGDGFDASQIAAMAADNDLARDKIRIVEIDGPGVSDIPGLLVRFDERALVIGRSSLLAIVKSRSLLQSLIRLSAMRGVPVLIPGPDQPAGDD